MTDSYWFSFCLKESFWPRLWAAGAETNMTLLTPPANCLHISHNLCCCASRHLLRLSKRLAGSQISNSCSVSLHLFDNTRNCSFVPVCPREGDFSILTGCGQNCAAALCLRRLHGRRNLLHLVLNLLFTFEPSLTCWQMCSDILLLERTVCQGFWMRYPELWMINYVSVIPVKWPIPLSHYIWYNNNTNI